MKKLSLSVAALLLGVSAWADQTWNIGSPNETDVTAPLTEADNTLTISGTGAMADYSWGTAPWYSYRSQIDSVSISGVTSIGNAAFYNCSGLTSVTIGDALTSIGTSAFYGCTGLTSVTIGSADTSIGKSAF